MKQGRMRIGIMSMVILGMWLVVGVGCGETVSEAAPTAVAETAEEAPETVLTARDAVLDFVRTGAITCVPPEGARWQSHAATDKAPEGFSVYNFTAEECLITVSYSEPQTKETLYHVALGNDAIGFCWQAVVDEGGEIVKTGHAAEVEPGRGNPAAIYCEDAGYQYEIRILEDGSECGACVFPDGSACRGWDFFHGSCRPGDNPDALQ